MDQSKIQRTVWHLYFWHGGMNNSEGFIYHILQSYMASIQQKAFDNFAYEVLTYYEYFTICIISL